MYDKNSIKSKIDIFFGAVQQINLNIQKELYVFSTFKIIQINSFSLRNNKPLNHFSLRIWFRR
jgi:hypothetical protein